MCAELGAAYKHRLCSDKYSGGSSNRKSIQVNFRLFFCVGAARCVRCSVVFLNLSFLLSVGAEIFLKELLIFIIEANCFMKGVKRRLQLGILVGSFYLS